MPLIELLDACFGVRFNNYLLNYYETANNTMKNPYESPTTLDESGSLVSRSYGGISRKTCFFSIWPLGFLWGISKRDGGAPGFAIFVVVILVLLYFRAKNIGLSSWVWVLALIPAINILFLAYCLIVPPGYANTKRLDLTAYLLIMPLLALAGIFAIALAIDLAALLAN